MANRLIKVAKELNVGTATIVEFLEKSGFEIDNKPTAKVTDEMHDALLMEFQKSAAIKEKADQLIIGSRATKKENPPPLEEKAPLFTAKKQETSPPPPPPPPPPVEPEEVVQEPEEIVAEKVEEKPEEIVTTSPKLGLKVKGKIDLDKPHEKKKKEEEEKPVEPEVKVEEELVVVEEVIEEVKVEEPVKEVPPVVEVKEEKKEKEVKEEKVEKVVVDKAPEKVEEKKEEEKKEEEAPTSHTASPVNKDEVTRMKTPQLKGLKILGKIDTDKLKKPKKKKKVTPTPATGKTDGTAKTGNESNDPKKKRKRTRKKVSSVPSSNNNNNRGGNNRGPGGPNRGGPGGPNRRGGPGRREVKEVSQKEIDEQIKQTMARLSGGGKRKRQKMRRETRERHREKQEMLEAEKEGGKLQLTEFVTVSELASLMDVPVTEVITTCMNLGVIVSINQRLDAEVIELVTEEFGHEIEFISAEEEIDEEEEIVDDPADLQPRAPIVTVMGHVDHGKTSLLDFIREATVADGEAGGITQHIGAYEVLVGKDSKRITFLDTPGHEAFTAMRARGAKVTDVAVIIISADDRIMPQTKEAISHAQAAGVPMVFAINKIDKDGADPERIKQELSAMNFLVEDWGGSFQSQDISAKQGTNIDQLLEKILLEAELLELKANPDRLASGTVIEASLDKGRGYVTKILVQTGTLKIGDAVVAGGHSGKIKAMFNERGKKVKIAGPSVPVLVLGLSGAPQAGEKFKVMPTEQEARQIASRRSQISREQANRASRRISLDEIGRRLALGTFKELNLIVKGDVDGSVEALSDSLIKLSVETIQVNVIHKAVGQIIESDVLLATASDAIVIGFQVRPSLGARKLAEREGVQIKGYSIIYEAIEEIKMAIEGMLEPTKEERITAQVDIREVYKISRVGTIAGCYVSDGKIARSSSVRIVRDGIVIYPTKEGVVGEISSLKRFKDDAKEVKNGLECGISIKNFNDLKVGDVIEGYEIVEIKQTLD